MPDGEAAAAMLAAVERIARAHDGPAVSAAEERAKANAILDAPRLERVLSLLVPPEHGGQGLTIATAAHVVAAVAAASGSAGLICAMHFGRLAERQVLIASATSEVGVGGDILTSICRTTLEGKRHCVANDCANIAYLDQAGATLLTEIVAQCAEVAGFAGFVE